MRILIFLLTKQNCRLLFGLAVMVKSFENDVNFKLGYALDSTDRNNVRPCSASAQICLDRLVSG